MRLNLRQIHRGYLDKKFSVQEIVRSYLNNIRKQDSSLGAFLDVQSGASLEEAARVDKKISRGEKIGLLEGIPIAIKDIILVKGLPATAGSKILKDFVAPYDAEVIRRLKKDGMIIIGKTNLDEFAMGSSTEFSAFHITRNPCDLDRVPGGSSGGSAAAVASEEVPCALGTDTGGSIRQPASFCGIVGLKPTYGRVSRFGLIAFVSSFDQIGPMARSVDDVGILLEAMSGPSKFDATSGGRGFTWDGDKLREKDLEIFLRGLRIGVIEEFFQEGLDSGVRQNIKKVLEWFSHRGAKLDSVSLPLASEYALAAYYVLMPSEAASNLARYDGVKYGLAAKGKDLYQSYFVSRRQGFGPEVKRRIFLGNYVLSAGYYERYYSKAQKVRALLKEDFQKAFGKFDILLGPTCPTVAFKVGEKLADPLAMYLSDIYTVCANLAGLPAISVPCGEVDNLPVGLQLIGNLWEEKKLLLAALAYEKFS